MFGMVVSVKGPQFGSTGDALITAATQMAEGLFEVRLTEELVVARQKPVKNAHWNANSD